MNQADVDRLAEGVDDDYRAEPRRPPPAPIEYILGGAIYLLIMFADAARRLIRRR